MDLASSFNSFKEFWVMSRSSYVIFWFIMRKWPGLVRKSFKIIHIRNFPFFYFFKCYFKEGTSISHITKQIYISDPITYQGSSKFFVTNTNLIVPYQYRFVSANIQWVFLCHIFGLILLFKWNWMKVCVSSLIHVNIPHLFLTRLPL